MWRLSFCIVIGSLLVSNFVMPMNIRDSYVKALDSTRRVSPSIHNDLFFSGLYNTKGKLHDKGSDFGLTSDVYTKPNPYYTKNQTESKPQPVYHPVYNHSVTQDAASSSSDESYDHAPSTSYESKGNSYSGNSNFAGSYSVQSAPSFPSSSYNVPSSSYGSPGVSSNYGSPGVNSYYPAPSYGPPTSYGPSPSYGPSHYPTTTVIHQMPEAQKSSHSEWFIAKIMKKFDLILVSKILLKLIIFKKIVKFIGIICLLMFIPILKKKFEEHTGDSEEDEDRRIKPLDDYANVDFRLKEITNFALTAIEGFQTNNIPWCVGESEFYCRLQYMLDSIDIRYSGSKIIQEWFPNLQTTPATPTKANEKIEFNDHITESSELASTEVEESEEKSENFKAMFGR